MGVMDEEQGLEQAEHWLPSCDEMSQPSCLDTVGILDEPTHSIIVPLRRDERIVISDCQVCPP
jgi:hypothetical protein